MLKLAREDGIDNTTGAVRHGDYEHKYDEYSKWPTLPGVPLTYL